MTTTTVDVVFVQVEVVADVGLIVGSRVMRVMIVGLRVTRVITVGSKVMRVMSDGLRVAIDIGAGAGFSASSCASTVLTSR